MPELPEVERGRRLAESVAAGRRIAAVACAADPIVYADAPPAEWEALAGRRVLAARRWGKQLWFDLETPPHPLFHFGMSGGFRVPGDTPLKLATGPVHRPDEWPPRYWKVRFTFNDGGELVMTDARRLGRLLLRAAPREEPPVSRLGFDPLLALPPPRRFAELLAARSVVIKSLFLDQGFAAGVGNWIADEILYQACIDPRRRGAGPRRPGSEAPSHGAPTGDREGRVGRCGEQPLPQGLALPSPLGEAGGGEDRARRGDRAHRHRRSDHRLGAGRPAVGVHPLAARRAAASRRAKRGAMARSRSSLTRPLRVM